MSRQAIVGLFTLAGLIGLFVVYFVLADLLTQATGYKMGIHFTGAAGLARGSTVFESGIQIGTVDEIRLPGDRRRECRAERMRDGVPIAPALIVQLDKLAAELKVTPLRER